MKTHDDVRQAFDDGTVVNASKEELEQLLLAVGRARVQDPANQARSAEMGETMRQLLAARQSQRMHSQALSVARIALFVSALALIAALLQILVGLNLISAGTTTSITTVASAGAAESLLGPNNSFKPTPLRGAA